MTNWTINLFQEKYVSHFEQDFRGSIPEIWVFSHINLLDIGSIYVFNLTIYAPCLLISIYVWILYSYR